MPPSKEEQLAYFAEVDQRRKQTYEAECAAFEQLDSQTKVPHLLIELRNLGFIEIQGKNTGGIYEKLDEWFRAKWMVAPLEHDIGTVVNDE